MQCAEITEAGKPLKITSRPIPEVPVKGVLLKMLHAGVCHSDLHIIEDEVQLGDGKVFRLRDHLGKNFTGLVLGHEICGEIIAIGSGVSREECSLKIGEAVVVFPWRGCRQCECCTEGNSNLCENNSNTTTEIGQGKHSGGYGSYVAAPDWETCVKLPNGIQTMIGCMLPCSALTAYCAIIKARPHLDMAVRMRGVANLLVIGVGGLGHWCIFLLKHLFCDQNVRIICADVEQGKLDSAVTTGADDTVLWEAGSSAEDLVMRTTMSGFNKMDAAIDFVGSPKTFDTALKTLHKGGGLVAIGLGGGSVPLSIPMLISNSVSIHGARAGSVHKLKELVELLSAKGITNYPPVEVIKLEQINEYLDKLRKGEIKGRVVIEHGSKNIN